MKKKVLLVEREWEIAGRLPELLVEMGLEVEVVASGALALNSLREAFPDMIVTDCEMTGLDGSCFLKSLKDLKLLEHIPVLVTGENRENLEDCANKGVFVRSRPYAVSEFAQFISQMA